MNCLASLTVDASSRQLVVMFLMTSTSLQAQRVRICVAVSMNSSHAQGVFQLSNQKM